MLRSIKDLEGSTIGATDGIIGRATDFYFDDEAWVIRYLFVDAHQGHMLNYRAQPCDLPARS
jgi:hypothetical protein